MIWKKIQPNLWETSYLGFTIQIRKERRLIADVEISCWVCSASFAGKVIGDFHKLGSLKKLYLVKKYPTLASIKKRIEFKLIENRDHISFYISDETPVDIFLRHARRYITISDIDKIQAINGYLKNSSLEKSLMGLSLLEQSIEIEHNRFKYETAIWDSLDAKYKGKKKRIFSHNETRSYLTNDGWSSGRWTVSPSDYRDDVVYVPPEQSEPTYSTYVVDVYNSVDNMDYIPPPEYPEKLQKLKQKRDEIVKNISAIISSWKPIGWKNTA